MEWKFDFNENPVNYFQPICTSFGVILVLAILNFPSSISNPLLDDLGCVGDCGTAVLRLKMKIAIAVKSIRMNPWRQITILSDITKLCGCHVCGFCSVLSFAAIDTLVNRRGIYMMESAMILRLLSVLRTEWGHRLVVIFLRPIILTAVAQSLLLVNLLNYRYADHIRTPRYGSWCIDLGRPSRLISQ